MSEMNILDLDKEIDDIVKPISQARSGVNWVLIGLIGCGVLFAALFVGYLNGVVTFGGSNHSVIRAVAAQPPTGKVIKGNKNTLIFHLPQCRNYNDIAKDNIVWFETAADAKKAGYRLARNC